MFRQVLTRRLHCTVVSLVHRSSFREHGFGPSLRVVFLKNFKEFSWIIFVVQSPSALLNCLDQLISACPVEVTPHLGYLSDVLTVKEEVVDGSSRDVFRVDPFYLDGKLSPWSSRRCRQIILLLPFVVRGLILGIISFGLGLWRESFLSVVK